MNISKMLNTVAIIMLALTLGKSSVAATAGLRLLNTSSEPAPTDIPAIANDEQAAQSQTVYLPLVQASNNPSGSGQEEYRLTINISGQGSVIASPAKTLYAREQLVTLSVIAASGWKFVGWSGHLAGNANPATLIMQTHRSVTAQFVQNTSAPTATDTSVPEPTPTNTPLPPPTDLPTATFTPSFTPIATNTPVPPTNTPSSSPTSLPTATFTPASTRTSTPTFTPTVTNTPTPSPTVVNQPPVVDAGGEQTITWPATASLNGTVTDDGLPSGQLTVSWHKVSGPGNVTFTPVDQPTTTAGFSTPGNYVLILIADDGALNNHALVAITVNGTAPAAPSNVQVTAVDATTLYISWTDNADNEEGFTVDEGSTAFDVGAGSVAFTHGGLAPNSRHCYSLAAFNTHGRSAATDWVCATTPPAPVQIESLNVRVRYEHRDNAIGWWQDIPFQVTIKDASGSQVLYQTGNWVLPLWILDGNYGTATLLPSNPALVYGQTYQIFIRGAMHLTRRVTTVLTEGMRLDFTDPTLNPNGALWGCDINQDNQVSQADVDIVIANMQAGSTPPASPDPNSPAYRSNINGDQFINISDISACSANMGKVGD